LRLVKVVVVLPEPPFLEGGAAGRCSAGLLEGLHADERIELSAVAAHKSGAVQGAPPPGVPVEIVSVPRQDRLQAWADIVRRPLGYLSRGEFGERVRRLAAAADVLYLDQTETAWCDLGTDVPAVVHLHYLALLDQPRVPRHPRIIASRFGVAAAQRYAWQRHRFLLANSATVADELRRWVPRADVTVVPLVLDPEHYPAALDGGEPVAGFIGSARWPMTARAARRLVDRVWPLVRREVPEARLVIAGRGMDRLGLGGDESVEIRGEVPSGAAFMGEISVLVFPPVGGSGMKVKTLEAIASGVPVVTTEVGAEGIAPNEGVVVAEDDESLARATVSMLRDDAERKQRGHAGLQAFRKHHTPEVAAGILFELFSRMASSA
jgi:glycosyltransferase involved in cell wall biosynthesis